MEVWTVLFGGIVLYKSIIQYVIQKAQTSSRTPRECSVGRPPEELAEFYALKKIFRSKILLRIFLNLRLGLRLPIWMNRQNLCMQNCSRNNWKSWRFNNDSAGLNKEISENIIASQFRLSEDKSAESVTVSSRRRVANAW